MLTSQAYGTVRKLTRHRGANKPYTVPEYNYPFPSEYPHEKFVTLGAMAAFYDSDAVYQYVCDQNGFSLEHKGFVGHYFEMLSNPLDFLLAPLFVLAFRMGYVDTNDVVLNVKIPKEAAEKISQKICTHSLFLSKIILKIYTLWTRCIKCELSS